jgi:hypothetical protein
MIATMPYSGPGTVCGSVDKGEGGVDLKDEVEGLAYFCVHLRSVWRH